MRRTFVVGSIVLVGVVAWFAAWRAAVLAWRVADELDSAAHLAELGPRPQSTIVYDRAGHVAFAFFEEQRTDVSLDRVAPVMVQALLAMLQAEGLARIEPGLTFYAPASSTSADLVERLAETYSRRVVEVAELIHSGLERQARDFADAFRLRRDE